MLHGLRSYKLKHTALIVQELARNASLRDETQELANDLHDLVRQSHLIEPDAAPTVPKPPETSGITALVWKTTADRVVHTASAGMVDYKIILPRCAERYAVMVKVGAQTDWSVIDRCASFEGAKAAAQEHANKAEPVA